MNLERAALRAKVEAVFTACSIVNQAAALRKQPEVTKELLRRYGAGNFSAQNISEVVNLKAHAAHIGTLHNGWSYGGIKKRYSLTQVMESELYVHAAPLAEMQPILEKLTDVLTNDGSKDPAALTRSLLSDFGKMYFASHIKQSFEAAYPTSSANN